MISMLFQFLLCGIYAMTFANYFLLLVHLLKLGQTFGSTIYLKDKPLRELLSTKSFNIYFKKYQVFQKHMFRTGVCVPILFFLSKTHVFVFFLFLPNWDLNGNVFCEDIQIFIQSPQEYWSCILFIYRELIQFSVIYCAWYLSFGFFLKS